MNNQTIFSNIKTFKNDVFTDNRGYFFEGHNRNKNPELPEFIQSNISFSHKKTIRGIHFQIGFDSQAKYITVLQGRIWDVAVDVNLCSPTYGMWMGVDLWKNNSIYIPHGYGHAFLALEDSLIVYQCSAAYNKSAEKTIVWNDKNLNIDWPIKDKSKIIVSEKDRRGIKFQDL